MTTLAAQQWMVEQRQLGRSVCLILDSLDELTARNGLLNNRAPELYCRDLFCSLSTTLKTST